MGKPIIRRTNFQQRFRLELSSWTSLAFMLSLIEGGVIGVLIKNGFTGQVTDWLLNIAVAIATGAPFYSNLISFIWVKISHGKNKEFVVSQLAIVCCLSAMVIGIVPIDSIGLFILLVALIISRICWSGILTIRSIIWRFNYPRHIRGKITAKLATLTALLMSLCSLFVGWVLDWNIDAFRWVFYLFAFVSLLGAYRYRFLSVRHQEKQLHHEKANSQPVRFSETFLLLKQNKDFGRYMLAMFVLGSGNLMFMAPLIVFLNEHTSISKTSQIMISTAIPLALIPIAVNWWARLLDGNHVFKFRAIHSWAFVAALFTYCTAQISQSEFIFFVGAILYGIAIAGGVIGWNLGHNDFVKGGSPMQYMSVHVTLTGIRGLIAPLIGIGFYQWLTTIEGDYGKYSLILPMVTTFSGAVLFTIFNKKHQAKSKKSIYGK